MCNRCCAVASAVTFVVILAAVLVGIFVGGPRLAQNQIDNSRIYFSNSTLLPCANLESKPYVVEVQNAMRFTLPGFLGVTIQPYVASLSTLVCPGPAGASTCANPEMGEFGVFDSPEVKLDPGHTLVNNTFRLNVSNSSTLMNAFIFPQMTFQRVVLRVISNDVTAKASFLTFGHLKLNKTFTCNYVSMPPDPWTSSKYCPANETGKKVGNVTGISMECVEGLDNVTTYQPTIMAEVQVARSEMHIDRKEVLLEV